jgi:hypothetical protein
MEIAIVDRCFESFQWVKFFRRAVIGQVTSPPLAFCKHFKDAHRVSCSPPNRHTGQTAHHGRTTTTTQELGQHELSLSPLQHIDTQSTAEKITSLPDNIAMARNDSGKIYSATYSNVSIYTLPMTLHVLTTSRFQSTSMESTATM